MAEKIIKLEFDENGGFIGWSLFDSGGHTQNTDTGTTGNTFTIDSDSVLGKIIVDVVTGAANKSLTLTNEALTDNRIITLPDKTGLVALTSDLSGFLNLPPIIFTGDPSASLTINSSCILYINAPAPAAITGEITFSSELPAGTIVFIKFMNWNNGREGDMTFYFQNTFEVDGSTSMAIDITKKWSGIFTCDGAGNWYSIFDWTTLINELDLRYAQL